MSHISRLIHDSYVARRTAGRFNRSDVFDDVMRAIYERELDREELGRLVLSKVNTEIDKLAKPSEQKSLLDDDDEAVLLVGDGEIVPERVAMAADCFAADAIRRDNRDRVVRSYDRWHRDLDLLTPYLLDGMSLPQARAALRQQTQGGAA